MTMSHRLLSIMTLVLLAGMVVSASNPTLAQPQCGNGQGKGPDVRTCTDEIMDEQERTIDLLDQMTQEMGAVGLLQADQMDAATRQLGFLRNSHARGRSEKGDATDDEFGALAVMGEASQCEIRLLPRYAMGPPPRPICTDAEIAANQCEEVCEFNPAEKARNEQRGLRLEEDLAEALEQTRIANDDLEAGTESLAALSLQGFAADADPCEFVNPHPAVAPFPPGSIMFHNQILVAHETITNIGKGACRQDAFGFNASSGCIALDILQGVQKGLTTFVTTTNVNYTAAKVNATFDCVTGLKAASDDQDAKLATLERKVDTVTKDVAAVKALLDEVRVLLSTPQGQREGFPAN